MSKVSKTQKPPITTKPSRSLLPKSLKARRRLVIGGALFLIGLLFLSFGFVGGTLLEEHNDFCASCHTVPESTYFNRSVAAIANANTKVACLKSWSKAKAGEHTITAMTAQERVASSSLGASQAARLAGKTMTDGRDP